MHWREKLRGFYAILDRNDKEFASLLVSAAGANANVLQLRLKGSAPLLAGVSSTRDIIATAKMGRDVAHAHGALFIVNDRLDIALAIDADGVHLGQDDLSAAEAVAICRGRTRPDFLIGVSTHDEGQVTRAVADGADYLGYGPVFVTSTKENPDPVQGVVRLARAVELAGDTPVVAIGGVTPERVAAVAGAGAWAACSIGGVNGSVDPAGSGRAIGAAFAQAAAETAPPI